MHTKRIRSNKGLTLKALCGGQFTLTIQLIKPNYFVILPHRHSTTVSLKTYPLYTSDKVPRALENLNDLTLKWMK